MFVRRVQSCVWRLPKYWPPHPPLHPASLSSPRTKGRRHTYIGLASYSTYNLSTRRGIEMTRGIHHCSCVQARFLSKEPNIFMCYDYIITFSKLWHYLIKYAADTKPWHLAAFITVQNMLPHSFPPASLVSILIRYIALAFNLCVLYYRSLCNVYSNFPSQLKSKDF